MRKSLEDAGEEQARREEEDVDHSDALPPPRKGTHPSHFVPPEPPVDIAENEWVPGHMPGEDMAYSSSAAMVPSETLQAFWEGVRQAEAGDSIKLPASFCQPRTLLQAASDSFLHADMITDAAKHAVR